ncbi:RDD family protein [Candidatus Mycoplasma mahonii]|uniref:RDD family protein n=1 Tax=Candidatus Mycoplasma mahonii TaxID=3004105 RepID=UPI0026EC26AD|nr:RDD family protein [Candidatus Mycoplasma mahonii]WKX02589.1 RDD family protein [Candidatus Mycoplasma mahonii]
MAKNKINVEIDNIIEMPFYSKKGILVEFPKYNKKYYKFIFLRVIGFAIDFLIPGVIQFLIWSIFKKGIILSGLATIMYYNFYYFTTMMILKNRTIGMVICRQHVIHKTGFLTSMANIYLRSIIMSVYALPYIGWGFMFLNFMSLFLLRGLTIFDLISQTIVISNHQYETLKYIEREEL